MKEFLMSERALGSTLALRNSFRRDLLREEMNPLKRSLETLSPLQIRVLELTGVSGVSCECRLSEVIRDSPEWRLETVRGRLRGTWIRAPGAQRPPPSPSSTDTKSFGKTRKWALL